MLRLVGTIISVTFDDDCDFTGDLERFMADDDILESDLRWPKVRWGLGLELRCCDQAATWMKLNQVMLVSIDRLHFQQSQLKMAEQKRAGQKQY